MHEYFERLQDITKLYANNPPGLGDRNRILHEIRDLEIRIMNCFAERVLKDGYPKNEATSKDWFSEKVVGATSFATMAVDPTQRDSFEASKIIENVTHYSNLALSKYESW